MKLGFPQEYVTKSKSELVDGTKRFAWNSSKGGLSASSEPEIPDCWFSDQIRVNVYKIYVGINPEKI